MITLFLPLSRERYINRLLDWASRNRQYFNWVYVVDTSPCSPIILRKLAECDFDNITYQGLDSSDQLADKQRSIDDGTYFKFQEQMVDIYSQLYNILDEYTMIVEEDVLPPDNCIHQLMSNMTSETIGVSGVVPVKDNPSRIIAGCTSYMTDRPNVSIAEHVIFAGFGCLLLNNKALKYTTPIHSKGVENFDVELFKDAAPHYRCVLDWSVRCQHGD